MIRSCTSIVSKKHQVHGCLEAISSLSTSAPQGQPPENSATIIQGPSLLTSTGIHRPSPSLFHLPGLRSLPFWTAPGPASHQRQRVAFNDTVVTSAIQHVESNYDAIKSEYFAAVIGHGNETSLDANKKIKPLEPDYDVASKGGEHASDALHSGVWDWHSYILNGRKNAMFKERCPRTAQVIDDVSEHAIYNAPLCFFVIILIFQDNT
jgi:hypothetical protein